MGFRNTAFFLQRTQKNRHVPKPLNSALGNNKINPFLYLMMSKLKYENKSIKDC